MGLNHVFVTIPAYNLVDATISTGVFCYLCLALVDASFNYEDSSSQVGSIVAPQVP